MIWAGIVVITFAIAVRIYPIFIFLLKERIKPLVEALYDKLPWIWEVSLSRYWDRLIDFLDLIATYGRALKGYKQGFANKKGNS